MRKSRSERPQGATTDRELRSLHYDDGLVLVDLDLSEGGLDERGDVGGELAVEGVSKAGLRVYEGDE